MARKKIYILYTCSILKKQTVLLIFLTGVLHCNFELSSWSSVGYSVMHWYYLRQLRDDNYVKSKSETGFGFVVIILLIRDKYKQDIAIYSVIFCVSFQFFELLCSMRGQTLISYAEIQFIFQTRIRNREIIIYYIMVLPANRVEVRYYAMLKT